MTIKDKKVAAIQYVLTDEKGTVIDQSPKDEPLYYLHGGKGIIVGLEKELEGKSAGDKLTVVVQPNEGYGEVRPELIQAVDKTNFGDQEVAKGMQFKAQTEEGMQLLTVISVTDDHVTVDANHELAGMVLTFDVTIKEVRDATEDELSHGHAHAPGHSHH